MRKMKQVLSLILVLAVCVSLISFPSYAATETVTFDSLENVPNKVYNLKSLIGDGLWSSTHHYMTEAEKTSSSVNKIAIGEGITQSSTPRNHSRTDKKFTPSADVYGGENSYIRTARYYNGGTVNVRSYGPVTEVIYDENGVETSRNTANRFNAYDANTYGFRVYKNAESGNKFVNGSNGWMSFQVSSDCRVLVGDWTGFGTPKYPNINPAVNPDAGWAVSDGKTNSLGTTTFYKDFKAGDTVVLPNYGATDKLANTNKVEYIYYATEEDYTNGVTTTYEAKVQQQVISWEGVSVGILWANSYSEDSTLASITAGSEVIAVEAGDYEYDVVVIDGSESISLSAVASDSGAVVECPETLAVGSSATIKVTSEGTESVSTYTVNAIGPQADDARLLSLQYKIADGEWTNVADFDIDTTEYTLDAVEYVRGGVSLSVQGTALNSKASVSAAEVTVEENQTATAIVSVTSEDGTATKEYAVSLSMNERVFSVDVAATEEYISQFKEGKYTGEYVIAATEPPEFYEGTVSMQTWDENGIAKNRNYEITIDGEAYSETDAEGNAVTVFKYADAVAIKKTAEEAGSTVKLSASGYNYSSSKLSVVHGSAFNSGSHNMGSMGSKFKYADFQIMTHREIAHNRIKENNSYYVSVTDTKTWLRNSSNYLFTVKANDTATVYVVMQQSNASTHKQLQNDGWKYIDYTSYFNSEILNSLPAEAIIDEYETLPRGVSRQWWMVEPSYEIKENPYSFIKIQYDTGSNTLAQVYARVWYKTIAEDEVLNVPTIGGVAADNDQHPLKAFVIRGEHEEIAPISADNTLSSLTYNIGGEDIAVEGFDGQTYEYNVVLAEEPEALTVAAVANDGKSTVEIENAVIEDGKGSATVTVVAENKQKAEYIINFEIVPPSDDAALKALTYSGASVPAFDAQTLTYTVELERGVEEAVVGAEANDEKATVAIEQADFAAQNPTATVTVTAEDKTTVKVYSVSFIKYKAPDAAITVESNGEVLVSVNGGEDSNLESSVTTTYAYGTELKLTAVALEGQKFMYWVETYPDITSRTTIISANPVYKFTAGSNRSLKAVFADEDVFTVSFVSNGKILIQSADVQAVPANPYIAGYNFVGWYTDGEITELKAGDALAKPEKNTVYQAGYRVSEVTYTVAINDGIEEKTEEVVYNTPIEAAAADEKDGQSFSHWERDGIVVSYSKTYSFYVSANTSLVAVYAEETAVNPVIVTMANPVAMNADKKIAYYAERNVDAAYSVVETGILLDRDNNFSVNTAEIKSVAKSTTNSGQYTVRKANVTAGDMWYAKAYVIYKDAEGNTDIAYSNLVGPTTVE